jgi:transcriptional regulator with XRE-family HTH domain
MLALMTTDTREAERRTIAAEVRAELARQQITQRELADRIGMFQQALQVRLAGRRPFRAEELAAIAAALGVPVTQFLLTAEPVKDSPATAGAGGRGKAALVPAGDGRQGTRSPSTRPHPDQQADEPAGGA